MRAGLAACVDLAAAAGARADALMKRALVLCALLAAGCGSSANRGDGGAPDLAVCVGDVDVGGACSPGCAMCKAGLACAALGRAQPTCRPPCAALPPPCASGFCCDTNATLAGSGGTTSTCEDVRLPGVFCDTLDGG